jgi:hypothetical protein
MSEAQNLSLTETASISADLSGTKVEKYIRLK